MTTAEIISNILADEPEIQKRMRGVSMNPTVKKRMKKNPLAPLIHSMKLSSGNEVVACAKFQYGIVFASYMHIVDQKVYYLGYSSKGDHLTEITAHALARIKERLHMPEDTKLIDIVKKISIINYVKPVLMKDERGEYYFINCGFGVFLADNDGEHTRCNTFLSPWELKGEQIDIYEETMRGINVMRTAPLEMAPHAFATGLTYNDTQRTEQHKAKFKRLLQPLLHG